MLLAHRTFYRCNLSRTWGHIKNSDVIRGYALIFEPLAEIDPERTEPETVTFTVDADQLSALVILANYARKGMENVAIPWAAGCQNIGIIPWREAGSENPRAIVGLTDISARKAVRKLLGREYLTFAVPWRMFLEMEDQVGGSFLQRPTWLSLLHSGTSSFR